eukprot:247188-Rhodomonas_salina.1
MDHHHPDHNHQHRHRFRSSTGAVDPDWRKRVVVSARLVEVVAVGHIDDVILPAALPTSEPVSATLPDVRARQCNALPTSEPVSATLPDDRTVTACRTRTGGEDATLVPCMIMMGAWIWKRSAHAH